MNNLVDDPRRKSIFPQYDDKLFNDKKLPFLDILLDNSHPSIVTSVYRKKTFTGLLTNYFSFAPLNYKLGSVRTLVDRVYKINNSWVGFHLDVKLSSYCRKTVFRLGSSTRLFNVYFVGLFPLIRCK